jgi:phosphonoacetaldehyde hydrolase
MFMAQSAASLPSVELIPANQMAKVVELAATNGYIADHVVATDQVPNGRPYPAQALANVIALGIDDVAACVKVDDTWPGIVEGRKAGMWTVALTCSGNALGLSYDDFKALPPEQLLRERTRICEMFEGSRPHYLIDTIVDLPNIIEDINARLARGEMPQAC